MRALTLATLLVLAAAPVAQADEPVLPTCTALVPRLQDDPSSLRGELRVLSVDHIVEDITSTQDARVCTGVAQYRDATTHITWTATWQNPKHTSFDVNAHDTTDEEAERRARSIRIRTHPPGLDGTFLVRTVVPLCADKDFDKLAENELRVGISFRQSFFREPDYHILSMDFERLWLGRRRQLRRYDRRRQTQGRHLHWHPMGRRGRPQIRVLSFVARPRRVRGSEPALGDGHGMTAASGAP